MKATLAELDNPRSVATPSRSEAPSVTASVSPSAVTPVKHEAPAPKTANTQGGSNGENLQRYPSVAATIMDGDGEIGVRVPFTDDPLAEKPELYQHTLSPNAIRQRSQRIFKRRTDGTLKVSQTIFDEWHSKGKDRKMLEQIFKQCGYDVEP